MTVSVSAWPVSLCEAKYLHFVYILFTLCNAGALDFDLSRPSFKILKHIALLNC